MEFLFDYYLSVYLNKISLIMKFLFDYYLNIYVLAIISTMIKLRP